MLLRLDENFRWQEVRPYLSIPSIARELDVSPEVVRKWIRSGELSTVKIDKFVRVPTESYQAFLRRKIA